MTRSDYEYDYDRTELEILKRDVMGRVRATARQREAILDKFERSGVSGPKFAQDGGGVFSDLRRLDAKAAADERRSQSFKERPRVLRAVRAAAFALGGGGGGGSFSLAAMRSPDG